MRCRYIVAALKIALKEMPTFTWTQCCEEALNKVNESEGKRHRTNPITIGNWYHAFRNHGETFDNMHPNAKMRVPRFLEQNPDQKANIVSFIRKNLGTLQTRDMTTSTAQFYP